MFKVYLAGAGLAVALGASAYFYYKGGQHAELEIERVGIQRERSVQAEKDRLRSLYRDRFDVIDSLSANGF